MSKVLPLQLFFLLFTFSAHGQIDTLEKLLSEFPETTFEKIETTTNFESTYELRIRQPLDHNDPSRGFFYQKVFLSHRGFDKTSVMATEGYAAHRNRIYEPTKLLNANQILIEHRYYGSSSPDSIDYRYLNMRQATADLHRIKQLFSDIYSGKWVSTGGSKGGLVTIFYRYFHPNDVDVSIPYVAPMKKSYEEQRIYHFLDTVGSPECRKAIKLFQVRLLKNREKILPHIKAHATEANETFSILTLNEAFEYAVMEYPFAFWQWGESCEEIPSESASIEDMVAYLIPISSLNWYSDKSIKRSDPHAYQVATELGYYGYETKEFQDLLIDLPTDRNPMCIFFSFEMSDKFNKSLSNDVYHWLEENGNKFIYIYGAMDPWSAAAVPQSDKVDSEWFMMKGKHHGTARIAKMNDSERERLISTLERWLSIDIQNTLPNK